MVTKKQLIANAEGLVKKKLYYLAFEQIQAELDKSPNDVDYLVAQANICFEFSDFLTAANYIERALLLVPDNPDLLHNGALVCAMSGLVERALELGLKSLSVTNQSEKSWLMLANIHERKGDFVSAREAFDHVIVNDKNYEVAVNFEGKLLYAEKEYDKAIDLMVKFREWSEEPKKSVNSIDNNIVIDNMFSLVKIYNKIGEYDKAWEAAVQAHEKANQKWDQDRFNEMNWNVQDTFTKENLEILAKSTDPFEQPVFIVGNARSGTSLLEQILSMHPDVGNGGELMVTGKMQRQLPAVTDSFQKYPECIFDMRVEDANQCSKMYREAIGWFSVGKKRVTNKTIGLQGQVGFLSLVLPHSRYIMLHRHPLDNCLSCFTTNLVHTGHQYTKTIESLGHTWVTRRKMQEYWTDVLDLPVMNLHYDKLVVDQESETRRLIEFLDLPWNDDCLKFHKSKRVAATISYDQVNQKMYTSSSGRWKNYEKHLGPLIEIVEEYL